MANASTANISFADRLAALKESLLAVPQAKLVAILVERSVYDHSLYTFLEIMAKAEAADAGGQELFEMAKNMIVKTFGNSKIKYNDAFYYVSELHAAHSVVEQIFEKGHYQQVIDLLGVSVEFEDNLASVSWPDDFMDTAYTPLTILALKSYLRLGKAPAEVAEIYQKMGEADRYGLFGSLTYLEAKDESELAPVKKILKGK